MSGPNHPSHSDKVLPPQTGTSSTTPQSLLAQHCSSFLGLTQFHLFLQRYWLTRVPNMQKGNEACNVACNKAECQFWYPDLDIHWLSPMTTPKELKEIKISRFSKRKQCLKCPHLQVLMALINTQFWRLWRNEHSYWANLGTDVLTDLFNSSKSWGMRSEGGSIDMWILTIPYLPKYIQPMHSELRNFYILSASYKVIIDCLMGQQ